jgi:flagellar biosynthesis protein FlhG
VLIGVWSLTNNDRPQLRLVSSESSKKRATSGKNTIWSIGGGKGGIGKSMLTANMAVYLAKNGYKTLVVDFDLGGANLHTWLGIPVPRITLSDFLTSRNRTFEDIVLPTNIEGLSLVNGAHDTLNIANLKYVQKLKLMNTIRRQDFDYVLIDLGGGTNFNTIDFFLMADLGTIVVAPEPISVENAYRFLKAAYYRKISNSTKGYSLKNLLGEMAHSDKGKKLNTPLDLLQAIDRVIPDGSKQIAEVVSAFCPKIILNMVREENDLVVGPTMVRACKKFFGLNVDYLGHISYDDHVWRSVKGKRPLLHYYPDAPTAQAVCKITEALLPLKKVMDYEKPLNAL